MRTRTAVVAASVLLTAFGVLPPASLLVFLGLIAGLAVLDVMAGSVHARRASPAAAPEGAVRSRWPVSVRRAHAGQVLSGRGLTVAPGEVLDLRDGIVGGRAVGLGASAGADGPESRRSRLADPVLQSLRAAYALGDWHNWQRSPAPGAYPTFLVRTDRGEHSLQVSHPRTSAAAVAFEVRLLDHLADAAFPAPRVVPTRAGQPWHQDGGLYLVTERLSGSPYDPDRSAHLAEAARGLAAYHEAVRSFPERLRSQGGPVLAGLEKNGPVMLAALADMVEPLLSDDDRSRLSRSSSYLWHQFIRVPEALSSLIAHCPRLVVHGSFGPEALHFEGDRLSGLAGYSRAVYDLRALDLADAIWGLAADGNGLRLDRCRAFLAAYAEGAEPAAVEIDALPLVLRLRRLTTVYEKINDCLGSPLLLLPGEGGVFSALVDLVETEAERLRWLDENEEGLAAALGAARVV